MDKLKQTAVGVALAVGAGIAAAQDFSKMEKPELVDKIVAKSLSVRCEPLVGPQAKEASYEARLRFAVASADTTDLRKLAKDNVSVCLNQKIDPSFMERSVHGAFFNLGNAAKVLMLADTPTGKPGLMGAQTPEVISRFNKFDLANTAAPNSTTYGVMGGPLDRMSGGRDRNYIQWVPESGAGDQVKEKGLSKLPTFTPPAPGV
jgi:hypothetical protein